MLQGSSGDIAQEMELVCDICFVSEYHRSGRNYTIVLEWIHIYCVPLCSIER